MESICSVQYMGYPAQIRNVLKNLRAQNRAAHYVIRASHSLL